MASITTPFLLIERFWKKVQKTEECWIWTGATRDSIGQNRNRGSYGVIVIQGKVYSAHRVSWEIHNGPIRNQLCVLHRCDQPRCVRPSHLWLGTIDDNNKDKSKKGRAIGKRGENCHMAKLTESDVKKIRSLHETGEYSHTKLASMFGVCRPTITLIINRINWKHI